MIKKFIDKLLGKTPKAAPVVEPPSKFGKRIEYHYEDHKIDRRLIDDNAIDVVDTLKAGGFEAYIVGGAVRDLLTGLRPKDFDVATNATPEQTKKLFRRAFIIGRRFRIVHAVYGREVIEISTFRAYLDATEASQVVGDERSREALAGKTHAVDDQGRVLRDNVWGPQNEDAARRDFTVNALYYDPQAEVVVDYHGGVKDLRARLLRMIGDPLTRYREDPVRMIRAIRFAAKTGFALEPATRAPIKDCAPLLANIPASRLFDETIKLLQTGHALESLKVIKAEGLDGRFLPLVDLMLKAQDAGGATGALINAALLDTDRRVNDGKGVSPNFLFACLFWPEVERRWTARKLAGEHVMPALLDAADDVLLRQAEALGVQRRIGADMREIWSLQPRFERRNGKSPHSLLGSPRFRAALDFFLLRAAADGQADGELATWWLEFSTANEERRNELIVEAASSKPSNRSGNPASSDAPRKRRRRRKTPAGEVGAEQADNDDDRGDNDSAAPSADQLK
jgi:poly(A) polymerase